MSTAMLAGIAANALQPAIFIQAAFLGTTVYIWSGIGSIIWNGHTWAGLGSLLAVSTAEDAATVEARGITIKLSGIDPTLLANALGEYVLGLPVIVYLGLYSSGTLISSPITAWAGRMDQPEIEVGATEATISIACENRLLEMNTAVDRRYTHPDTQIDSPGDLGCIFVDGLQQMTIFWGHYPATGGNV